MVDSPTGPPGNFPVDTDGFGGIIDWIKYPSDLYDHLSNEENKGCCKGAENGCCEK
jgi:hypothetical protein